MVWSAQLSEQTNPEEAGSASTLMRRPVKLWGSRRKSVPPTWSCYLFHSAPSTCRGSFPAPLCLHTSTSQRLFSQSADGGGDLNGATSLQEFQTLIQRLTEGTYMCSCTSRTANRSPRFEMTSDCLKSTVMSQIL